MVVHFLICPLFRLIHHREIDSIFNSSFILTAIQEGKFVHVSNKYELDSKVGSFYNFLTLEKSKASIQFSFPYVDFFGGGK